MMKTLNDYMKMSYRMEIVEDKDEGGYVVSYPDLPGCITCGETIEAAVVNAADAKKAWIEAALEEGIEIHEPDNLEDYSGQFKLRIPRSLHRSLAEHSKREGISMNQYCVYFFLRMTQFIQNSESCCIGTYMTKRQCLAAELYDISTLKQIWCYYIRVRR